MLLGSGKTEPGFVCTYMQPSNSTMYILPLSSMHHQYHARCEERGFTCEEWTPASNASNPPRVILVTTEKTNDRSLRDYAEHLVKSGKLVRVIVDEAHVYLTHEDFRDCVRDMVWVGQLGIQVVLQTGTASEAMVPLLFKRFGVVDYTVCRGPTVRSNISLGTVLVDQEDMVRPEVIRRYHAARLSHPTRVVLIFCRAIREVEGLVAELGISGYHSRMSEEERKQVMNGLRGGTIKAAACTSLLGVALDLGDVVYGIHFGYPRNMVDFAQEIGRLGRAAGCMAWSVVVAWKGFTESYPLVDTFGAELVRRAVDQRSFCRQLPPGEYFDGMSMPCGMHGKVANTCDNCQRGGDGDDHRMPVGFMQTGIAGQLCFNT